MRLPPANRRVDKLAERALIGIFVGYLGPNFLIYAKDARGRGRVMHSRDVRFEENVPAGALAPAVSTAATILQHSDLPPARVLVTAPSATFDPYAPLMNTSVP